MKGIRRVCVVLVVLILVLFPAGCAGSDLPGGMTREEAGLGYADGVFTARVEGRLCRTEDSRDGGQSETGAGSGGTASSQSLTSQSLTGQSLTGQSLTGQSLTGQPLTGQSLTGQPWSVAALVTVGAPGEDGSRVVSVQYEEPASLAGLIVTGRLVAPSEEDTGATQGRVAGSTRVTVTLGDLSTESAGGLYDRLLTVADALLAAGDIRAVGQAPSGGRTVTVAEPILPSREMVYTFAGGSATPTHVRMRDSWGWLELDVEIRCGGS